MPLFTLDSVQGVSVETSVRNEAKNSNLAFFFYQEERLVRRRNHNKVPVFMQLADTNTNISVPNEFAH